ncbi:MAG: hypothetical protein ACRD8Z_14760 [Nitrososphaeraceae archaeon]
MCIRRICRDEISDNNGISVKPEISVDDRNINNPSVPGRALTLIITTKNAGSGIIDGPSQTNVYTIKQIGSSDIADLSITNPKLADSAVTSSKLDDNAVTTPKIADGSVISAKLAFDIDPPRIATLAVKKIVSNPGMVAPVIPESDFTIHVTEIIRHLPIFQAQCQVLWYIWLRGHMLLPKEILHLLILGHMW